MQYPLPITSCFSPEGGALSTDLPVINQTPKPPKGVSFFYNRVLDEEQEVVHVIQAATLPT